MKRIPRLAFGLIVASWFAGLLLVAGCSKAPQPGNSVVRGSVSYKGQKLLTGMVEFWNQDGPVGHAPINPDGTYEAVGLATGNYQICVVTVPQASMKSLEIAGFGGDGKRPNVLTVIKPRVGPAMAAGRGGPGFKPGGAPKPVRPGGRPLLPPGAAPPNSPFPMEGGMTGGPPNPLDFLPKEKRHLHEAVQKKFGTVMVSKITITVQSGEQTFDLKLD
jgi:hypothetical protein